MAKKMKGYGCGSKGMKSYKKGSMGESYTAKSSGAPKKRGLAEPSAKPGSSGGGGKVTKDHTVAKSMG